MSAEYILVKCLATSFLFHLSLLLYYWYTGRRERINDVLGSLAFSVIVFSFSLLFLNPLWIAERTGYSAEFFNSTLALRKIESLRAAVQDHFKAVAYLDTGVRVGESIVNIILLFVSGGLSAILENFINQFNMASLAAEGLVNLYGTLISFLVNIEALMEEVHLISYSLIFWGACLSVFPRIRRLGITMLVWGVVLHYVFPFTINYVYKEDYVLLNPGYCCKIPYNWSVIFVEVKDYWNRSVPYAIIVFYSCWKERIINCTTCCCRCCCSVCNYTYICHRGITSFQVNEYGRKIALVPCFEHNVSIFVYFVNFTAVPSRIIVKCLKVGNFTTESEDYDITDGSIFYKGEYQNVSLRLDVDVLYEKDRLMGLGKCFTVVNGSCERVKPWGSLYRFRLVWFNENTSVKAIVYLWTDKYSLSIVTSNENLTVRYVVRELTVNSNETFFKYLYAEYYDWFNRSGLFDLQNWQFIGEEYEEKEKLYELIEQVKKISPCYYYHKPKCFEIELWLEKVDDNATVFKGDYAEIEVKAEAEGRWGIFPYVVHNPTMDEAHKLINMWRRVEESGDWGVLGDIVATAMLAYNILLMFVFYCVAADFFSFLLGGSSVSMYFVLRLASLVSYRFVPGDRDRARKWIKARIRERFRRDAIRSFGRSWGRLSEREKIYLIAQRIRSSSMSMYRALTLAKVVYYSGKALDWLSDRYGFARDLFKLSVKGYEKLSELILDLREKRGAVSIEGVKESLKTLSSLIEQGEISKSLQLYSLLKASEKEISSCLGEWFESIGRSDLAREVRERGIEGLSDEALSILFPYSYREVKESLEKAEFLASIKGEFEEVNFRVERAEKTLKNLEYAASEDEALSILYKAINEYRKAREKCFEICLRGEQKGVNMKEMWELLEQINEAEREVEFMKNRILVGEEEE
ncbi:MAG: hypothetical protein DRJ52_06235 [Thermoprotei archaeon]|nr:MAG: hypothetical protein DRJ52_06235 [Thermoprotei archaeon]